jgi:hypothetical protein
MRYLTALPTLFIAAMAVFAGPLHAEGHKYESFSKRDPFVPLVGGERQVSSGLDNISSIGDIRLEGIAIGAKGNTRAILNGEIVKENDKIGQLEIKKITKKEVIILFAGAEHTLALPEEGGDGGGK